MGICASSDSTKVAEPSHPQAGKAGAPHLPARPAATPAATSAVPGSRPAGQALASSAAAAAASDTKMVGGKTDKPVSPGMVDDLMRPQPPDAELNELFEQFMVRQMRDLVHRVARDPCLPSQRILHAHRH